MSTTETPQRPLRKDAERNRLRILRAAAEVFTEQGLRATLDAAGFSSSLPSSTPAAACCKGCRPLLRR